MGFNPRISSGPAAIQAAQTGRTYDCTRPYCTNAHKNSCQTGASTYDNAVTEDGFEYGGTNYPSLTKIAKTITGAQWSGPRFFGLLAAGVALPSHGGRDG